MASVFGPTAIYRGRSEIEFFSDNWGSLFANIHTDRLFIRSVEIEDIEENRNAVFFENHDVSQGFCANVIITKENLDNRICNIWLQRWCANDPYSGLAVFRKDTQALIGYVALEPGVKLGEAELAAIGNPTFWQNGYGEEAISAIVQEYSLATLQEGYRLEEVRLKTITASIGTENIDSGYLLNRLGMHFSHEKDGRFFYEVQLNELQKTSSLKAVSLWSDFFCTPCIGF